MHRELVWFTPDNRKAPMRPLGLHSTTQPLYQDGGKPKRLGQKSSSLTQGGEQKDEGSILERAVYAFNPTIMIVSMQCAYSEVDSLNKKVLTI